ncbi:actinia tenebrosa protease inhibitors-like [Asterias amurensis]|uniref:actinia tenebrosa protease inhibitors-like n=1 Tax=Asterias amurensis TaxID=7602 RepID=UPI003AB80BFA
MFSSTFVVWMSLLAFIHVAQFAELKRKGQKYILTEEELGRVHDVEKRNPIVFPEDHDGGICELPADPGFCRGAFPMIYFDYIAGHCKQFVYGGCGGNENRFDTVQQCHAACGC